MGENDTDLGGESPIDTGLAYRYRARGKRVLPIAPSHGDITNTNVPFPWPSPTACVKLDNDRFSFDSSFPHAEMSVDLPRLFEMRPPGTDGDKIAIFAHADPTGSDEYNKVLSGRRAKAVYGLLTRNPELWDQLHQQPFEGDHWGIESLYDCLAHLGYDPGPVRGRATKEYENAMHAFEDASGLPRTMRRQTRLALFAAYMDALVGARPGEPRAYAPEDFVGEGKEPDHRGAFQGCGERNPSMVVSKQEDAELAKPANHKQRNRVQAANRRVLIFLYAKEDVRDMSLWECPSAKAGPSACDKVAWSNKKERLTPGAKRREVRLEGKTFGCKFYDFTARISPCEALKGTLKIWLMDRDRQRMPNAHYRVELGRVVRRGTASDDGLLVEENVPMLPSARLAWAPSDKPHLIDAFAVDGAGGPDERCRALYRSLRDGLFPVFRGLLPKEDSPFEKDVKLSTEVAPPKAASDSADGARNGARRANLALDVTPNGESAEDPFHKRYGDVALEDVHVFGLQPGEADPGDRPAATATAVPPQRAPTYDPEAEILEQLKAAPKPGEVMFTSGYAYEKEVSPIDEQHDGPPPNLQYTTHIYAYQALGQDVAAGSCRSFASAVARVAAHAYKAFVDDPLLKSDGDTSKAAFGKWMMLTEPNVGYRPGAALHGSGSAVDLDPTANPFFPCRTAGAFGGERHGKFTQTVPDPTDPKKKVTVLTPLGEKLKAAYGVAGKSVGEEAGAIATRATAENVWQPCAEATDGAMDAIYGGAADLSARTSVDAEPGRSVHTRLALASSAIARFLALAYGFVGNLKRPMTTFAGHGDGGSYSLLSQDALVAMAVESCLMGYIGASSGLAKALPGLSPLEDGERTDESIRKKKIAEAVAGVTSDSRAALSRLQASAASAHEVLRRGVVIGSVSFHETEAAARAVSATTVFPMNGVPDAFGAVAAWRDPRIGFMNQRVETVEAFEKAAKELGLKLRWGAVDFGTGSDGSGDGMHFDFATPDPGVPEDARLAKWRAVQKERRLARDAHQHVVPCTQAWDTDAKRMKEGLAAEHKSAAGVAVSDLAAAAAGPLGRLDGDLPRLEAAMEKLREREKAEYDATFKAEDEVSARPHRTAVERNVAPAAKGRPLPKAALNAVTALGDAIKRAVRMKAEPPEPVEPVEPPESAEPVEPPEPPKDDPDYASWKRAHDQWKKDDAAWKKAHAERNKRHEQWVAKHEAWLKEDEKWKTQHQAVLDAIVALGPQLDQLEAGIADFEGAVKGAA